MSSWSFTLKGLGVVAVCESVPNLVVTSCLSNLTLDARTLGVKLNNLLQFFKRHTMTQLSSLVDLVVYDIPGKAKRFIAIYLLHSVRFNLYITVRAFVSERETIFSAVNLFRCISWSEREVWDLFGVFFLYHHDLRRILTDYGFSGHPLRKDFPLTGFFEIFYSDFYRSIVHRPVELMQEYRNFSFVNPWL